MDSVKEIITNAINVAKNSKLLPEQKKNIKDKLDYLNNIIKGIQITDNIIIKLLKQIVHLKRDDIFLSELFGFKYKPEFDINDIIELLNNKDYENTQKILESRKQILDDKNKEITKLAEELKIVKEKTDKCVEIKNIYNSLCNYLFNDSKALIIYSLLEKQEETKTNLKNLKSKYMELFT